MTPARVRKGFGGHDGDHATRCRRLWVAVVAEAVQGYWADRQAALQRGRHDERPVNAARSYFRSRDGRHVLSLAGLDDCDRVIEGLAAIVAGDVRPAKLFTDQHHHKDEGLPE